MAFVTTWSFETGYEGWTFSDSDSTGGASATRTHVPGAIRANIVGPASTNGEADHISSDINALVQVGDSISFDFTGASTGVTVTFVVRAVYSDTTTEQAQVSQAVDGTVTKVLTQNKTLERIEVTQGHTAGPPFDFTTDVLEVRLTTADPIVAIAGKLRTPQAFIEGEGAGAAGGAGGGSGGNLAAISADGLYIYIASFNSLGFPTLIRMPAPLNADGTVVFEPGGGGRIGVQAGELNAGMIWVAGSFDGTNTVEKSEDYGTTWTVKDDGIFGTVRTFQVGPGDDERVLVFDGDNGDILETVDDGETWTTINAAVSPLINSIIRLTAGLTWKIIKPACIPMPTRQKCR
jgi:hypothetical protein